MINKANIRKLIEHLKTVPEERFNIRFILKDSNDVHIDLSSFNPDYCNTVGCIIGHSYYIFNKEIQEIVGKHKAYTLVNVYYKKVFGFDSDHIYWNFLFSEYWEIYDGSIQFSIERLELILNDDFRQLLNAVDCTIQYEELITELYDLTINYQNEI